MPRACILCGQPSVAGRSRCSKHGPTSPTGPSNYDAHHQALAKQVLRRATGCANPDCTRAIEPDNPLQADHIIPLSLGGRVEANNYQALCRHCNISKGGANRKQRV